jgi:heat shock protein HslJ
MKWNAYGSGWTAVWVTMLGLAAGIVMPQMAASSAGRLEGPTWLAEDIGGRGVLDNVPSTLVFGPRGKVTGSGGCNRLFGTVTIAGGAMTFGGIGTTRKACVPAVMDQERKFLDALAAARTFQFDGAFLKLHSAGGAEVLRFTELR